MLIVSFAWDIDKNLSPQREWNPRPPKHRGAVYPLSYGETHSKQGHLLGSYVTRMGGAMA